MVMARVFTPLTESEKRRLLEQARAERRRMQDQAALYVLEGIARHERGPQTADAADEREPLTAA
jgi:hypothetical protein